MGRRGELDGSARAVAPAHVALAALEREGLPSPLPKHSIGLPANRKLIAQPRALEALKQQRLSTLVEVDLEEQQVVAVDDDAPYPSVVELLLERRFKVDEEEGTLAEANIHLLAVLAHHRKVFDLRLQHILNALEHIGCRLAHFQSATGGPCYALRDSKADT